MDWSKLGEVTDWNDLSKMMEGGGDAGSAGADAQANKGKTVKAGNEKTKQNERQGSQDSKREPNKGHREPQRSQIEEEKFNLEDVAVDGWTDMKQFDDDHDPDWFEEEENRLAETYGGHFIKVKYTEQGRPGYFCELCVAEMNAKKSLESHCEGMKHLKKKALWEKNAKGGDVDADPRRDEGRRGGWTDPGPRGRGGDMHRDRSPLRHGRDHRSRSPRRGPEQFGGGNRGRPGPRDDFRGPRDDIRGPRGDFRGHRDDFRGPRDDSRGPRDDFRGPRDDSRGPRDDFRGPRDDFRGPRDDFRGPRDDFNGPRDDIRGPPDNFHGPPNNGTAQQRWGGGQDDRHAMQAPAPPPKEKLGGGTTGMLLTKLAACYIKDDEDADLALNVISSLASSLREYNTKKGEKKIAELLMEAELKLNTLKALKVGLKLLDNKKTPGSSAAAAAAAASRAPPPPSPQAPAQTYMNPNSMPVAARNESYDNSQQWAAATPGYQGFQNNQAQAMHYQGHGVPQQFGQHPQAYPSQNNWVLK